MSQVNYTPSAQVSLQMIEDQLKKLEPQLFRTSPDNISDPGVVSLLMRDKENLVGDQYVLHNNQVPCDMTYIAIGAITQDSQRGAEPEPYFTQIKIYDRYYFTEDRVTNKVLTEPMIRDSFRFPGVGITEAQALEVAQFIAAKHHQLVGFGFPTSSTI